MTVPLNHFYLVLDSETYSAIEASDFLRSEFAVFEKRTTTRNDITYSGIYYYGRNTYFEFFDGGRGGLGGPGDSALAFGVETPGGNDALSARFPAERPPKVDLIHREFEGELVPWFSMLVPGDLAEGSPLRAWVMEYDRRFLEAWNSSDPPDGGGIRRSDVLERYKGVVGVGGDERIFEDIVEIRLALPATTRESLVRLCESFGYQCTEESGQFRCNGPQIILRLSDSTGETGGIVEVAFSLLETETLLSEQRFGPGSVLRFPSAERAIWQF